MIIASRTPEGWSNDCPVCGADVVIEPSQPFGDAPCPCCGSLLWFCNEAADAVFRTADSAVPRTNLIVRVMEGLDVSYREAVRLVGSRGQVGDSDDLVDSPTPIGPGYVGDDDVLTSSQIRQRYPDRWVLIENPVQHDGEPGFSGRVRFHGVDRDEVHHAARELCCTDVGYIFTGELPELIAL